MSIPYSQISKVLRKWMMKNGTEVKIKKRATFQTRNRLGLPDVSFCFSGKAPREIGSDLKY